MAGQLGLEPTPDAYVSAMVRVFREVHRVLRDDGTLWLNIGDSYAQAEIRHRNGHGNIASQYKLATEQVGRKVSHGLKPKDLIGIPWRLAFALQADGWYLRSDIIWAKPNPMPESVTDRPTKAHEYVFLLTKRERYFYDKEAVSEFAAVAPHARRGVHAEAMPAGPMNRSGSSRHDAKEQDRIWASDGTRNLRTVWPIATQPYSGAHFATMPPELARRCIRAGTSEKGCCPACGSPWVRVVESDRVPTRPGVTSKVYTEPPLAPGSPYRTHSGDICGNRDPQRHVRVKRGESWQPSCDCNAGPPVPCIVLDNFNGSGTTGHVATTEGRRYVGFDLNPEYLALADRRIAEGLRPVSKLDPAAHRPLPGQLELFAETV